jgi:hypothetical protein
MLAGNKKEDIIGADSDDSMEVWCVNSSDPLTPSRSDKEATTRGALFRNNRCSCYKAFLARHRSNSS